jgi:hypothetical protein
MVLLEGVMEAVLPLKQLKAGKVPGRLRALRFFQSGELFLTGSATDLVLFYFVPQGQVPRVTPLAKPYVKISHRHKLHDPSSILLNLPYF